MAAPKEVGTFRFTAPLILGNMINPLNSTMLATSIVSICHSFHQSLGNGALLIVPLYLTSAIAQPLMGRLCDVFSARKINITGFVIIFISALIGIFAKNFESLVLSRILLGLGSSAAYPSGMSLIRQRYASMNIGVPGIILGIIATSGQAMMAVGPFLGGILVENFGWKGIFFVNIPITIIGLLMSAHKKHDFEKDMQQKNISFKKVFFDLDPLGLLSFAAFLFILLLTLMYPDHLLISIPLLIASLLILIQLELKHQLPFINVRLLANNLLLNTTYLRQIFINFILYLVVYGLPQWIEQAKNIPPSQVGILMLPLSISAILTSLYISRRRNYIIQLLTGTSFILTASIVLFFLRADSTIYLFSGITILIGSAIGLLSTANQSTLYAVAPEGQVGISFGLYRTLGYLGAILAGSRLKHEFNHGANDSGLHIMATYALVSCMLIILFILPVYRKHYLDKRKNSIIT